MAATSKFGRVDADNNVFVLELGSERQVGQYPNVTAEEALAFFERKFADLEAQVRILEQRVKNKVDAANLGKQASKLADDLVSPSAVGDLNNLRNRVAALTPAIAELGAAKAEANKEAVAEALATRVALADAAEAIANQDPAKTQWKQSGEKMAKLFADWQAAQKTRFETAKRQFFASLDSTNKAVRAKKVEIVEAAEKLAATGSDSMVEYKKLLDNWKSAGRTPGKSDDALWARFKAAGDTIYSARQATAAVENVEQSENLTKKLDLLKQYSTIDPASSLDEAKKQLQELQKKWEKIGRIPKDKLREVEDKLRAIENKVKSAEQDHWRKSDPASIDRSNSVISQLEDSIKKLESELAAATTSKNEKKIKEATEALSARKAWLETVKAAAN
jgi:hypothetical protein